VPLSTVPSYIDTLDILPVKKLPLVSHEPITKADEFVSMLPVPGLQVCTNDPFMYSF
jgi:hypothetical protein